VDLRAIRENLKLEKVIIEEVIEQHQEISEFNSTSVNTLRLVTLLCGDGKAKVMTANFRCGNGEKYADNFHHNGIASTIDIPTGTVVTTGVGMDLRRYVDHPVTKKTIVGFKIPHWEQVVETVTAAAQVVPSIRYVGWDVAIGKDGRIIIVEGNCAAGQDVTQLPDQVGKWPLYKEELERIFDSLPN